MQGKVGTTWSPAECTCHLVSWSAHSSSKILSRISKGSLSKKGDDVWGSAVEAMSDRSLAMPGRELGCNLRLRSVGDETDKGRKLRAAYGTS